MKCRCGRELESHHLVLFCPKCYSVSAECKCAPEDMTLGEAREASWKKVAKTGKIMVFNDKKGAK